MTTQQFSWSYAVRQPVLWAVLWLSFASSLPLVLVGSTLQAWYTTAGVDLLTIGMLTLVGQPYVYKFLWAPVCDRFYPARFLGLDHRRAWIFLCQLGLVLGLVAMAFSHPKTHPWELASLAFMVAVLSATQDIAIDAYRVDVLKTEWRGFGAAVTSFGGRLAILVASALALIFAEYLGWRVTYLIMATVLASCLIASWRAPMVSAHPYRPTRLRKAFTEPLLDLWQRPRIVLIVLFIISYKLCDALAFALNTTFLLRGLGFQLAEVGLIYKSVSVLALLLGSFVGGYYLARLGLFRALWYFGIVQALSNLAYFWLALVGKNYLVMITTVFIEYFCSGVSTVAFVVFLMSLCRSQYSAAQYAILTAIAALARVFAGPEVALLVDKLGWAGFYFFTFLCGIPPIFILLGIKRLPALPGEVLAADRV
jgi:PAT family beta-lactamase induction signal transducer AmpG